MSAAVRPALPACLAASSRVVRRSRHVVVGLPTSLSGTVSHQGGSSLFSAYRTPFLSAGVHPRLMASAMGERQSMARQKASMHPPMTKTVTKTCARQARHGHHGEDA
jgi:hypothetical protein